MSECQNVCCESGWVSLLVSDCQLSTERRFATPDNTTYLQWPQLSVAADSSHFAGVAQVGGG